MNDIAVHIERLVLEGIALDGPGRYDLQGAVEAELSRLLSLRGLSAPLLSGGAIPGVTTPTMQVNGGESPLVLGRQIAGAIHGGIAG